MGLVCLSQYLALEHLAGEEALAHDQPPSLSMCVSEVARSRWLCGQCKVNWNFNSFNIAIGPHPLAYYMRTCPRTSLHECQQQRAFRSKPLSVLVHAVHSLAVSDLGEL